MKLYFVVTDRASEEIEVIRQLRPPRLLGSYHYFRTKGLAQLREKLGYDYEFRFDSGAYSAWSTGKNISPLDYMKAIDDNREYITDYIALDVIGDPEITRMYYDIMRYKGYYPIPVFHYGDDTKYLDYYIAQGHTTIALGGTAKMRSKPAVVEWVNAIIPYYPGIDFHLLGSSSRQIMDHCDLASADSSTWIIKAFNGKPKHIPGKTRAAKVERAKFNMEELMETYKEESA